MKRVATYLLIAFTVFGFYWLMSINACHSDSCASKHLALSLTGFAIAAICGWELSQ